MCDGAAVMANKRYEIITRIPCGSYYVATVRTAAYAMVMGPDTALVDRCRALPVIPPDTPMCDITPQMIARGLCRVGGVLSFEITGSNGNGCAVTMGRGDDGSG